MVPIFHSYITVQMLPRGNVSGVTFPVKRNDTLLNFSYSKVFKGSHIFPIFLISYFLSYFHLFLTLLFFLLSVSYLLYSFFSIFLSLFLCYLSFTFYELLHFRLDACSVVFCKYGEGFQYFIATLR